MLATPPGPMDALHKRSIPVGILSAVAEIDHAAPTIADRAWHLGFSLALDGIDADPPDDYSPFCRDAFAAGMEAGRLEMEGGGR